MENEVQTIKAAHAKELMPKFMHFLAETEKHFCEVLGCAVETTLKRGKGVSTPSDISHSLLTTLGKVEDNAESDNQTLVGVINIKDGVSENNEFIIAINFDITISSNEAIVTCKTENDIEEQVFPRQGKTDSEIFFFIAKTLVYYWRVEQRYQSIETPAYATPVEYVQSLASSLQVIPNVKILSVYNQQEEEGLNAVCMVDSVTSYTNTELEMSDDYVSNQITVRKTTNNMLSLTVKGDFHCSDGDTTVDYVLIQGVLQDNIHQSTAQDVDYICRYLVGYILERQQAYNTYYTSYAFEENHYITSDNVNNVVDYLLHAVTEWGLGFLRVRKTDDWHTVEVLKGVQTVVQLHINERLGLFRYNKAKGEDLATGELPVADNILKDCVERVTK